jgi:hypothetical protein
MLLGDMFEAKIDYGGWFNPLSWGVVDLEKATCVAPKTLDSYVANP